MSGTGSAQPSGQETALPDPDAETANHIWRVVVYAFSIVLVGAAIVLAVGIFLPTVDAARQITKADILLTVFTTAAGFLAGLLAPSPVANKTR